MSPERPVHVSRLLYDTILSLPQLVGKELRLPVKPCTSPRMTRRDSWRNPPRPCVARYRAFKDALREAWPRVAEEFPRDVVIVQFMVPMPESWSEKKKKAMEGEKHEQKPDIDNYIKALFDAALTDDQMISGTFAEKRWAREGSINIVVYEQNN